MPHLILPVFYYHDHFMEMLLSVESVYAAILDETHHGFIQRFRALPKDQQCLYIRMTNRKGCVFRISSLQYSEIDAAAHLGLLENNFIRPAQASDMPHILAAMTKDQLLSILRQTELPDWRSSWPKARLAAYIAEHLPHDVFSRHADTDNHIVQLEGETVAFLLYLYFGKRHDDLKSFTLRDLNIVRVNDNVAIQARFTDAAEAKACFFFTSLLRRLETKNADEFECAAASLKDFAAPLSDYAQSLQAKAAHRIGQFFEKQKDAAKAIEIYRLSPSHDCNERLARLLHAGGERDQAAALLTRMIDDPASDEEYIFATDFYARKFDRSKIGSCTALLRGSRSIAIDDIHRNGPEHGAMAHFRRDHWRAYRTENIFWHSLFGLLFWDELFGGNATLHSGFDTVPHCLKDKSFAVIFSARIDATLNTLRSGHGLQKILKTIATAWETPNGIFNWEWVDIDALGDVLNHADRSAIVEMIALMTRDFYACRDGFPDLMLARDGIVKFVEIKAEGDLVRRNQLTRLHQLQQAGLHAEICRVTYTYDPDQIYVVVDIETTGGRASTERITEIGAVKIRNHQVMEEWHSLINPQRRIPAYITALTGISDEMVRAAPLFSEVADSLTEFMGDAIFVAHNVNFDYGFIAEEYRRLEKTFRYPKFCTVAGMRRHYPGQDSYSLGHLCERYTLPLETHHRALCDAKAAGHLLSMINRRRCDDAAMVEAVYSAA